MFWRFVSKTPHGLRERGHIRFGPWAARRQASHKRRAERRRGLAAGGVVKDRFDFLPSLRPVRVQHRAPRGVAIAPLYQTILPEDPLEAEAQPHRGHLGPCVQTLALPLHTPVSQPVNALASHQANDPRVHPGSLRRGGVPDAAELESATDGNHVHEGCHTGSRKTRRTDGASEARWSSAFAS